MDYYDDDNDNDPVLALLRSTKITREDIEQLCKGFEPSQQEDVKLAFLILTNLESYIAETSGWMFSTLSKFDFQTTQVGEYDIHIAVLVGNRSEFLLREISSWGIQLLKAKVNSLHEVYNSDAGTVLTILVLRIISKYADLEFKLQVAISRSTLVKIHSELGGLLANIKGDQSGVLALKYKAFVSQLLQELETTPFEEVQQEMFQVVRDLHAMFLKWAAKHNNGNHEDEQSQQDDFASEQFPSSPMDPPPSMESSWRSEHFAKSQFDNRHRRTFSGGSSSAFSTASTTKTSTSITDDLPAMLHAFETARSSTTNEDRSPRTSGILSTTPIKSSPLSYLHHNQYHHQHYVPSPLHNSLSHSPRQPQHPPQSQLQSQQQPQLQDPTSTMEVKMVQNRMMVRVDGKFVDMQDWANQQNKDKVTSNMFKQPPKPQSQPPKPPPPQPQLPQLNSKSNPMDKKHSMEKRHWLQNADNKFGQNYINAMDAFD